MSEDQKTLAIRVGAKLETLDDMFRYAKCVVQSGLAPKGDRPETVLVKLQAGAELGLTPTRALQCLTAVNGRLGMYANTQKGLVEASGVLRDAMRIEVGGDGDARCAVVSSQRKGWSKPVETRFSVADAKRAGLWGKSGPWSQYPDRMLQHRAISHHCSDHYNDILMGIPGVEMLEDLPASAPIVEPQKILPPDDPDPLLGEAEVAEVPADVDQEDLPF